MSVFDGAAFGAADRPYVTRVIGVGGDRVRCCDARHRFLVNGRSVAEPYLRQGDTPSEPVDDVVGRVVAVTWPFPRAGGLPTYAAKTHRGALGAPGALGEGTTR